MNHPNPHVADRPQVKGLEESQPSPLGEACEGHLPLGRSQTLPAGAPVAGAFHAGNGWEWMGMDGTGIIIHNHEMDHESPFPI